jgi:tetratricopeptide (TPR) repeat protein
VFYNGRESLKQASKKIEAIEPQDFDDILPVFAFEYKQAAGTVSGETQRVLDKSAKAVQLHSITAKPKKKKNLSREEREFYNKKEFNRFIDDAQLLAGKANLYMHEYSQAFDKFEFILMEYPKESSTYEAMAWQAVIFAYNKEYGKAENILTSLNRKKDAQILRKIEPLINAAYADLYIKQKKYAQAIPYLENALKGTRKKYTQIRYHYILGQLYGLTADNSKATYHFSKLLKKNPPYFTAFNAEMSMAHAYDPTVQKGKLRKTLEKALRNEMNKKYHDQIYYAFAKLEESEGNKPAMLEYYRKSVNANGTGTRQKGLSYLAMADHYMTLPDYIRAYTCYDSAAIMLGSDHSFFDEVSKKAAKYRKLALNMKIIVLEDSLLYLASLSDKELDNLIDRQLEQAEEKRRKAEEDKQKLEKLQSDINSVNGQWYFYNPASLALGRTDFSMKWGDRKLEDNWRRKNKGVQIQRDYDDYDTQDDTETFVENTDSISKKDAVKANIPKTAEAKNASNEKIINAMFNVGEAYCDDLDMPEKAAEMFEKLNERFPENNLLPESYVALYSLYSKSGNIDKAGYYRNLMLQKFPQHPKTLAATDPGYIDRMLAVEVSEEIDYNSALALYTANKTGEALRAAEIALKKYPSGRLVPQFSLLKALSSDYNGNIVDCKAALNDIITRFKGNQAAVYAKTLLNELEKDELETVATIKTVGNDQTAPAASVEKKEKTADRQHEYSTADGKHAFVIIVNANVNTNRLRFNVIAFNAINYPERGYDDVKTVDFANYKMLIMSGIKDKKEAVSFYAKVIAADEIFNNIPQNEYVSFVILDENLKILRSSNSFSEYVEFFNSNYN